MAVIAHATAQDLDEKYATDLLKAGTKAPDMRVGTGKDGKDINIDCDSVISCAGYIPAPLAEKSGKVHLVGDCLAVGNLRSVVWRAYDVAMKI